MKNLNKNIEVFFIDLDGTLLDAKNDAGKHIISQENIAAVKEFASDNHVVISTGRLGTTVEGFMKDTGVEYAVTGNGSLVVNNKGKVFKEDKLSIKQVLLLVDFAKKHKLTFKVDAVPEAFGAVGFISRTFASKNGFAPREHYNVDVHVEYHKMVFWGKCKRTVNKLVELLNKEIDDISVVTSSNGWTIEVTNIKATKGLGNMKVAELLGIKDKKKMAHIGDTMNDSTTIKYMRFIAMGNSNKSLKEMTQFIGPSYKKAGVAKILKGEYIKKEKK